MLRACSKALAAVTEELFVALGLLLIAAGFWQFWRPGSFVIPGAMLLWLFVPQRQRFVAPRPTMMTKPRRKDA